jgi:thiosulfate/3-mercaptopyruvate sulfurtransferase
MTFRERLFATIRAARPVLEASRSFGAAGGRGSGGRLNAVMIRSMKDLSVTPLLAAVLLVVLVGACGGALDSSSAASSGWPWGLDSVTPAEFAKELAGASGADKPVVVCTAPPFLYRAAHIPGAVLHGPASSPDGLNSLTKWAETLPRASNVVIYCGCCPLAQCPNLAPAYRTLKGLGFTRVRVLLLQDSFKTDWFDRGYPYVR